MANRKALKDPEIEAANEIYKVAREQADMEMAKLKEEMEGRCFEAEAMGILKKIDYDLKHNELIKYSVLCRVKQNKEYRMAGKSWEEFCQAIGEDRRNVDRVIEDLRPVVNAFSDKLSGLVGVPFQKIRYLGRTIPDKLSGFEDGALLIDGEKIPLTPEHKDEIEAAIDALKEAHKKEIDEKTAMLRAKDKVLKAKEQVINKQEKELAKFEGRAKAKGYAPEEEAFLNMCSTHRSIVDELFLKIDAENFMPAEPTPRMKAAYVELVGYILRTAQGLYDTGTSAYDMLPDPDGWTPPGEIMPPEMVQGDEAGDCSTCPYHKGMGSKAHGVKIPGGYGKCTRPEGHCSPANPSKGI